MWPSYEKIMLNVDSNGAFDYNDASKRKYNKDDYLRMIKQECALLVGHYAPKPMMRNCKLKAQLDDSRNG